MRARIGIFDVHVQRHPLAGMKAWIILGQNSAPPNAPHLIAISDEAMSYEQLVDQVRALKADLDEVVRKAAQLF